MEKRVAVMGIIVENMEVVEELNSTLHEYSKYIIGRMGIPYENIYISVKNNDIIEVYDTVGNYIGMNISCFCIDMENLFFICDVILKIFSNLNYLKNQKNLKTIFKPIYQFY